MYGNGGVVSIGQVDGRSVGNRGGPNHSHAFSGSTSSRGAHSHSYGALQEAYMGLEGTGGSNIPVGFPSTQNTSGVGDHNHSFSGQTSGGYDQDKPSFAGVQFVITTGIVATA